MSFGYQFEQQQEERPLAPPPTQIPSNSSYLPTPQASPTTPPYNNHWGESSSLPSPSTTAPARWNACVTKQTAGDAPGFIYTKHWRGQALNGDYTEYNQHITSQGADAYLPTPTDESFSEVQVQWSPETEPSSSTNSDIAVIDPEFGIDFDAPEWRELFSISPQNVVDHSQPQPWIGCYDQEPSFHAALQPHIQEDAIASYMTSDTPNVIQPSEGIPDVLAQGFLTSSQRKPRVRQGRRCANQQSASSSISELSTNLSTSKSRVAKEAKSTPKAISKPKARRRRRPADYTWCDFPGCAKRTARPVDMPRHWKVAHGDDDIKFLCLFCLDEQCKKKPKAGWVFGTKYNLIEHLNRLHKDTSLDDPMMIRMRKQEERFPLIEYYVEKGKIPPGSSGWRKTPK
ncbi:hypothetical protein ACLMJK_009136 [Lecanora helva]